MKRIYQWLKTLLSGKPHFIIGDKENPYLYRWYILPRNHRLNIYLHKFLRDDDDRALHDHPWWFLSIMLKGGYIEVTSEEAKSRRALSVQFHPALYRHRVVLWRFPYSDRPQVCWTLVITGPKQRTWGFWCPKGFVPWYNFVKRTNEGDFPGGGCGENS